MREICYLCGRNIDKKNRTLDHVPPQQIFPSRIRKKFNLSKLVTLPTHRKCNEAFQADEVYFFNKIGMVDYKNPVLREVWYDIRRSAQKPESQRFNQMLLSQVREEAKTPGGIIIPGKVAIEYDDTRINRVLWKIVRGLFFIEFSRILPEDTIHIVTYFQGQNLGIDPESVVKILNIVRNSDEHGQYKRIFAYKYVVNPEEKKCAAWAVLFWDRHLFLAAHHDPDCDCDKCKSR